MVHSAHDNDRRWLYACDSGLSIPAIRAMLNAKESPIVELSARHWQETWRAANDLLDAYGYPATFHYKEGQHVNWDSMRDYVLAKSWRNKRFVGQIVVVRDTSEEVERNLALLADVLHDHFDRAQRLNQSTGSVNLILDGWHKPSLTARIHGYRVDWPVFHLE